jgi:hypothetical protein
MGRRGSSPSPSERALRGRIGAHLLHATHDSRRLTEKARAAFMVSFERQVDPDDSLPADERRRRAAHARAAHFARLARMSCLARAQRKRRARRGGG